jgi:hypothetical protein
MINTKLSLLPDITQIDGSLIFPATNNNKTYKVSLKNVSDFIVGREAFYQNIDYTITDANRKSLVIFNPAQGLSLQVLLPNNNNENIPVGASIDISNNSLSSIRIVGDTGVEINSALGDYIVNYGIASISKIDTNKWILSGDLMTTSQNNWSNAKTILDRSLGTANNGVYIINSNPTYCLMDPSLENGGWMLAMKATRDTTFNYSSNYWTTNNTLNPSDTTRNDGDAKYHIFNTYVGTQVMAVWPDVGVVGGSLYAPSYGWIWKEDITTPSTLLNLFQNTREISNDALTFPGMNTAIWSHQTGYKRYGFNMIGNTSGSSVNTRWGFVWNNENDANTCDASGGIGLSVNGATYSAGDWYSSAGTQGLNRSMRVEIYIR